MDSMGSINALIIEDNQGDVRLIRAQLAEQNIVTVTFARAERLMEGLSMLSKERFDVVLLDLNLPDSGGLDTVRTFLSKNNTVPVIVLTGLDDDTTGLNAIQVGAQDYLVKGSTDGSLLARTMRYAIERKKTEEALRKSEEKYRQLVETAYEGIWLLDEHSNTVFVNNKMAEMLGYDPEEMAGKSMLSFTDPEWRRQKKEKDLEYNPDPAIVNDFKFRRKDGTSLWGVVSSRRILDNSRNHIGTLAMITDITDRKRMEEDLRRAKEELEKKLKGIQSKLEITSSIAR
jgi:two-component system, NarL family, sensor histidine kinase UhpB